MLYTLLTCLGEYTRFHKKTCKKYVDALAKPRQIDHKKENRP